MKPFDDSIPEEIEIQHAALVSMLQQALPRPVQLTPDEQAKLIERASQRLLLTEQAVPPAEGQAVQPAGAIDASPIKKSAVHPFVVRRGPRVAQFASMLAAVLVIAAIIGASLLLFTHRPQQIGTLLPQGTPVGPVGKVTIASEEAGGLEASMEITGAPYFLSEILAVDLSLTNHSQTTFTLEGRSSVTYSFCDVPALSVDSTGESAPFYTLPQMMAIPCPSPGSTQFKPGQTISLREYYVLSGSGHVKLTEGASFLSKGGDSHGNTVITVGHSPLDGHWPTIQLNVNSHVPADRTLSFHMQGPRAFIDAPLAAQHHLLYEYNVSCQVAGGGGEIGEFIWQPIPGNEVSEPGCSGKDVKWIFAFGAPGFAIVSGNYTS
jgi:hypothetical protein